MRKATALHLQRDPTKLRNRHKPAVDSHTVRILDRFLHLHHFSARHVEVSSPYHGTDQQVLAGAVHHVRHLGPHAQEARCVGFVPSCTVVSYSHGLTTPARLMQCLRWTTLSHKKSSSAPSASASWNRSRTRYRALLSAKVTPECENSLFSPCAAEKRRLRRVLLLVRLLAYSLLDSCVFMRWL